MRDKFKSEDALRTFIERSDRRLVDRLKLYFPMETQGFTDKQIALAYWKWLMSDNYSDVALEGEFIQYLGDRYGRKH